MPNCHRTEFVTCPRCGYKDQYGFRSESGKYNCVQCEKPFTLLVEQTTYYTTKEIGVEDELIINKGLWFQSMKDRLWYNHSETEVEVSAIRFWGKEYLPMPSENVKDCS